MDPITKEYPELTPYQFGSNRPIDGIDWDGKEWRSSGKYYNPTDGKFHQDYKIGLSLNYEGSSLSLSTDFKVLNDIKYKTEAFLSNGNATGSLHDPIINVNIEWTQNPSDFKVRFFDLQQTYNFDSKTGKISSRKNTTGDSPPYTGKTHFPGNSQANIIEVTTSITFATSSDGKILRSNYNARSTDEIARTLGHELGHTVGLKHPWDQGRDQNDISNTPALYPFPSQNAISQVLKNLMNSEGNQAPHLIPSPPNSPSPGNQLLPEQRKKIEQTVKDQQNNK